MVGQDDAAAQSAEETGVTLYRPIIVAILYLANLLTGFTVLIGLILAFGLPIPLIAAGLSHVTALVAVLSHVAGVLCLRWLFFAQAEHVVGLYYGKR